MARGGQMIDASIVQTPKQSIKKEEKDLVAAQAMPADWSPAKRRQKDVETRWTKKHGKSYFGYKLLRNNPRPVTWDDARDIYGAAW